MSELVQPAAVAAHAPLQSAGAAEPRQVAITMTNVGKRYRIGVRPAASLYDRFAAPFHRGPREQRKADVWALRNVSFEVPRGVALGVLGRNGSGKTTLMKILARVTAPTEGTAEVVGRLSALLQVGTGFHPELTGRDNIALSGAILGMSRDEIRAVEPAVIEFAEIDQYLDTPVKHYSSGMYLRLAFSVSAHMDADIMLLDEVLAVGDQEFQAKCRARIRSLVTTGRTVLFVSHSMASIRELCDSALVLDRGRLVFNGDTETAIETYSNQSGARDGDPPGSSSGGAPQPSADFSAAR